MSLINISGYKFTNLTNLEVIQSQLKDYCQQNALKGTILLAHEGINAFLSGSRKEIDGFYQFLPTIGFSGIAFKESISQNAPFKHMRVKIKKEIVTMGVEALDVVEQPAPYVSPQQFQQWLDENKDIVVLDTRNDYEVTLGKFDRAIDLNIKDFRSFPKACDNLAAIKDKTIVTYCTGGIRCEKAAPFLISQGFKNVFQLEGGILKYLEEFADSHFKGECFVFDKRMAVDEHLNETKTVQCHGCRHPVSEENQKSPHYLEGKYCPNCYETLSV